MAVAEQSPDTDEFNKLSRQRFDFEKLPGGGIRGRITVTLPGGRPPMVFVEDLPNAALGRMEAEIHGCEIGFALAAGDIEGAIGYADSVFGREGEIGLSIFKRISRGVKKVGKSILTSKLLQTAAKGLAVVGPFVPGIGTAAAAVSAGLLVAGKLAGAKAAEQMGASRTAAALAKDAVATATRVAPAGSAASLLRIASDKSTNAIALAAGRKPPPSQFRRRRRRPRPRVAGDDYSLY